jgi:hypothetical protein
MFWVNLLQNYSNALIGLCGVIIGGLLGGLITLLTQSQQRNWILDDQKREWKRIHLQERSGEIKSFLEQWLRVAHQVGILEDAFKEVGDKKSEMSKDAIIELIDDIKIQKQALLLKQATVETMIGAIGDSTLTDLFTKFFALCKNYTNIMNEKNLVETIKKNKKVLSEASGVIINILQRNDELLEKTFSSNPRKK